MSDRESNGEEEMSSPQTENSATGLQAAAIQAKQSVVQPVVTSVEDKASEVQGVDISVVDKQSEVQSAGISVQAKPSGVQAVTSVQAKTLGVQTAVTSLQPLTTCTVAGLPGSMTGIQTPTNVRSPSPIQPLVAVASTPESIPASGLSDLKLIYINKSDSEIKSPTSISLTNGVSPKMVQIPAGGNPSGGFAYVGTIIKQGKDVSEGQKVLLTPVIKDGGRFILPRTGGGQVKPNIVSNSTSSPGQIILSQGQQPRRSFLIHNPALSKDLKGKVDGGGSGSMLPKILPLPKVPVVVSSSRSNDVSVSPLKASTLKEEDVTKPPSVDVSSLLSSNKDASKRELPPLSPIYSNSQINAAKITNSNSILSDNDDVELVSEGNMPLPIAKKISLKPSSQLMETPTSPTSVLDSPGISDGCLDSTGSVKKPVDQELSAGENVSNEQTEEKLNDTSSNPEKTEGVQDKAIVISEDNSNTEIKEKPIRVPSSIPTCKLFVSSQQSINNEALKKFKGELPGIKVAGPNGHFVRILSTCSGAEARELAGKHALLLKDGKAVVLGTLSKDQQPKDTLVDNYDKSDDTIVKTDGVNSLLVQNKVQKTFPLVVSPTQEYKNTSNETPGKTDESPKTMFNLRGLSAIPSVIGCINMKEGLQVKELSKESVMLERSRKRKGAPLLRDCFRKTIAVKRLEPLSGAASIHPLQVIDWDMKTFVGNLPGSDIKFVVNSYGALQVYEGDGIKQSNPKTNAGVDVLYTAEQSGKDDIGRCIECECYGLLVEFIEERYCSISCRERNQTRKALITKRSLALTKENTNKKRRLFEMALSKARSTDENDNNNKMKPSEPRHMKTILLNNSHIKDRDKNDKTSTPNIPEPLTTDKSTSAQVNSQKPPPLALTAALKQPVKTNDAMKAAQRLLSQSNESIKEESMTVKPCEEKKPHRERRVSLETNNKASSNTQETVSEKSTLDVFDWCEYLSQMRSHPAWVRLFKDAFPSQPNLFRVGHRLEAVDPQRPSLFCAVSVTQVKGYRIKLHFDGYGKVHDFWLNADSPNIFPCGFCHSHGIELEPPWGFNKQSFNWSHYLTNIKARPAPPKCFIHKLIDSGEPNLFKVGMKLEAVDKKNSFLVCVATVAAVVDHRILIHFDSWDDSYDYWTEYYSPNIHPVGWCQRNNYVLTPPNGQKRKNFSWRRYLNETGAESAPDSAFMVRPPIKFKKGSKLEVIDPRAPHLLRVATIKQVLPYQLHVVFDGFPDHFGKWFDDDSPDLHPIGWSTRTGHTLSPPPKQTTLSRCSTPGCQGDGNVSTGDLETHYDVADCPYSNDNLDEENLLPDRLSPRKSGVNNKNPQQIEVKKDTNVVLKSARKGRESTDVAEPAESSNEVNTCYITPKATCSNPALTSTPVPTSNCGTPTVPITIKPEPPDELPEPTIPITNPPSTSQDTPRLEGLKEEMLRAACDKFVSRSLSMVSSSSEVEAQDLLEWDSRKVTSFIEALLHRATNAFYNNKVDGEGLLMLNEDDLSKRLSFNELEASTIYSNIITLRNKYALQSN